MPVLKEWAILEARLIEDPKNEEMWQVFGDLLSQAGDIRGEIIALEYAEKLEEADALCVAHEKAWLDPGVMIFRQPGYADDLEEEVPGGKTELFWKYGFVWGANIEAGWDSQADLQCILIGLFHSEASRFLFEVTFEFTEFIGTWDNYWAEGSRCLRWLTLNSLPDEFIDMSTFPSLFPRLERLFLSGLLERCTFGTDPWPYLSLLCLKLVSHVNVIVALSHGNFPSLAELSLICDRVIVLEPEREEALNDLIRLLNHSGFPALKELTLTHFCVGPGLVLALTHSPILPKLTRLNLTHNELEAEGARLILENFEAFAHLELDLAYNNIPEDLHYALKQRMEPSFSELFGEDPENDTLMLSDAVAPLLPDPTEPQEVPNPGDQAHPGAFLEEKIFRTPDDPNLWKQYAHYLISQQDPRGNLILELLDPTRSAQAEASLALQERRWCDPALMDAVVSRTWKHGYLYEVTLLQTGISHYNDEGYDFIPTGTGARQLLPEVVFAESARFLQRLIITYPDFPLDESVLSTQGIPSLKYLKLGSLPENRHSWGPSYFVDLSNLGPLAEALPELEELDISGLAGELTLHQGESSCWKRLKTLRLHVWGARPLFFQSLLRTQFPALTRMELTLDDGQFEYEEEDLAFLRPFLNRTDLPLLREVFFNGKPIPYPPR